MTCVIDNEIFNAATLVGKTVSLYLPKQSVLILSIGVVKSQLSRFQVSLDVDCNHDKLKMYGLSKRRHSLYLYDSGNGWRYEYDGEPSNTSELHPLLSSAMVELAFTLLKNLNKSPSLAVLSDHSIHNFTITVNPHSMSINHVVNGHGYCISTDKDSHVVLRKITRASGEAYSNSWAVQAAEHPTEQAYNELFSLLAPLMVNDKDSR